MSAVVIVTVDHREARYTAADLTPTGALMWAAREAAARVQAGTVGSVRLEGAGDLSGVAYTWDARGVLPMDEYHLTGIPAECMAVLA